MIGFRPGEVTFLPGEPKAFALTDTDILRDLERRASNIQMGARFRVRVRTGKLLSTIRKNNGKNSRGQYVDILAGGSGANYVMFEHDGTRPHEIAARRRKTLRFVYNGQVVFAKRVYHPGTQGSHFLERSLPLGAA